MTKTKKITQLSDAESIIGEDEAKKIENAMSTSKVAKSDVLIEMSDTEPTAEETAELITDAEKPAEDAESEVAAEENPISEPATETTVETIVQESAFRNDVEPESAIETDIQSEPVLEKMVADAQVELKSNHPLQSAIDELIASVDNSIKLKSDAERAELVNPALQKLGIAIQDYVAKSDVSPAQDENDMLKNIKELIQPLADSVKSLADEVGVLKAQYGAQGVKVDNRIPQPRTIPAQVYRSVAERPANKPFSTDEIARKSVGIS